MSKEDAEHQARELLAAECAAEGLMQHAVNVRFFKEGAPLQHKMQVPVACALRAIEAAMRVKDEAATREPNL